jgi:hypothetical protein
MPVDLRSSSTEGAPPPFAPCAVASAQGESGRGRCDGEGGRGLGEEQLPNTLGGATRTEANWRGAGPLGDGSLHACRSLDDPFASDCATDRSSPGASPLPCERACGAPLPAWSPRLPRGRWRPLRIRNSASCLIKSCTGIHALLRPHAGSSSGKANLFCSFLLGPYAFVFSTAPPTALRPTDAVFRSGTSSFLSDT